MLFTTPDLRPDEVRALGRIEEQRRPLRYYVATSPSRWFGSIRRLLAARAIRGSNSIEGFNVSVEDALAAVEGGEPTDRRSEDFLAVQGYQRAMTYVLQLADDPYFEYTAQLIRSLHFMMTEDFAEEASPGLWRPGSIWVKNEASGEIVYEAPDHHDVPLLVNELIDTLISNAAENATVQAAMAHLNLAMIHPFRDGNGRMSRCIQTLVLAGHGVVAPELSSIEEFLGRDTDRYYAVLSEVGQGRWNPSRDARPWVRYCLGAHFVQGASVVRRIDEWREIWERCEAIARHRRLPSRVVGVLADVTYGLGVRNSSYRTRLEASGEVSISAQLASRDLSELARLGLLVPHGARRGASYSAGNELVAVRAQIRAKRTPLSPSDVFSDV
jgi:Fic family protein